MTPAQQKTLDWLAHGETGISSKTMAFWLAFDIKMKDGCHPLDPADFDRCLRLLDAVPELRPHLANMAKVSPQWARLVKHWADVEQCHLDEVGLGWAKARSAPITYDLMQRVLYGKRRQPGLYMNSVESRRC